MLLDKLTYFQVQSGLILTVDAVWKKNARVKTTCWLLWSTNKTLCHITFYALQNKNGQTNNRAQNTALPYFRMNPVKYNYVN